MIPVKILMFPYVRAHLLSCVGTVFGIVCGHVPRSVGNLKDAVKFFLCVSVSPIYCSVGGCKLAGISYEQDVELRGGSDMQSFFENQRVFQCLKITFVWFSL